MKRESIMSLCDAVKGQFSRFAAYCVKVSLCFCNISFLISPFEDVLEGHVAVVGVELQEEGWIEGIRVPDEAEHSHGHLSQQRPGDIAADVQQVLDADSHTVLT